jgi:mannose-1-phosphate guanylyltransferase
MIRNTIDRLNDFLDYSKIHVITARAHADRLKNELTELPPENIIVEPTGRDTAPCAGLTGLITEKNFDEDTVIGFFPADHQIDDTSAFRDAVEKACSGCRETGGIVTFGIEPTRPATGYGYIIPDNASQRESGLKKVKRFTEKPDRDRAQQFIENESALWNSGMFFWSANTILSEIQRSLPKLNQGLQSIRSHWHESGSLEEALNHYYADLPETSVDYGVIEQSENVWTLPVYFDWNDLGTWDSVESLLGADEHGNHITGDSCLVDVEDSILVNRGGPTVGAVGLEDCIIVSTEDAVLVCPKSRAQDVKQLVRKLESEGRDELL